MLSPSVTDELALADWEGFPGALKNVACIHGLMRAFKGAVNIEKDVTLRLNVDTEQWKTRLPPIAAHDQMEPWICLADEKRARWPCVRASCMRRAIPRMLNGH